MTQPILLENLRKAYMGNYSVILSLLGCLDHGMQAKRLVDRVIDASASLLSKLWWTFLISTLNRQPCYQPERGYSSLPPEILPYDDGRPTWRRLLEQSKQSDGEIVGFLLFVQVGYITYVCYSFFMIAFASFVEESDVNFSQNFSGWLKARTEMWTWVPLFVLIPTPLLTGFLPFPARLPSFENSVAPVWTFLLLLMICPLYPKPDLLRDRFCLERRTTWRLLEVRFLEMNTLIMSLRLNRPLFCLVCGLHFHTAPEWYYLARKVCCLLPGIPHIAQVLSLVHSSSQISGSENRTSRPTPRELSTSARFPVPKFTLLGSPPSKQSMMCCWKSRKITRTRQRLCGSLLEKSL